MTPATAKEYKSLKGLRRMLASIRKEELDHQYFTEYDEKMEARIINSIIPGGFIGK